MVQQPISEQPRRNLLTSLSKRIFFQCGKAIFSQLSLVKFWPNFHSPDHTRKNRRRTRQGTHMCDFCFHNTHILSLFDFCKPYQFSFEPIRVEQLMTIECKTGIGRESKLFLLGECKVNNSLCFAQHISFKWKYRDKLFEI